MKQSLEAEYLKDEPLLSASLPIIRLLGNLIHLLILCGSLILWIRRGKRPYIN